MSSLEIFVPDLPESVADATVATWHKQPGDSVQRDEVLVEIETDKVILEVPAVADGVLEAIVEDEGATVVSRQLLGRLKEGNSAGKESSAVPAPVSEAAAPAAEASEESNDLKAIDKTSKISSKEEKNKKAPVLPHVSHEVMRTLSERHSKGLMSPYIYQILSQVCSLYR
jgi:pyruvate/2-oxoglutarate dehydrogenase complex dihydrolipoamide acyltransferase (E2) component